MDWINSLKIAIITKDTKQIESLMESMPDFSSIEEMKEALYMIKEGIDTLEVIKSKTLLEMQTIKKNIDFLKSSTKEKTNLLDVSY